MSLIFQQLRSAAYVVAEHPEEREITCSIKVIYSHLRREITALELVWCGSAIGLGGALEFSGGLVSILQT